MICRLMTLAPFSLILCFSLTLLAGSPTSVKASTNLGFADPSGDWDGSYLILWEDGSPRWWGNLDLNVDAKGLITGTGDLYNSNGGYWTLVVQAGVVGPDGAVRIVFHDSVNDTVVFHSITSDLQGDTWTLDFRLVATYDVLPGVLVLNRS